MTLNDTSTLLTSCTSPNLLPSQVVFGHQLVAGDITRLQNDHLPAATFKVVFCIMSTPSPSGPPTLARTMDSRAHSSASCLPHVPGHPTPSRYLRQYAKDVLGLRESWNNHSNWGMQALSLHLLNVHVDKDLQVCDWEGELTDEQMSYVAMDVILPHLLQHCLFRLRAKGCKRGSRVISWNFGTPPLCFQ